MQNEIRGFKMDYPKSTLHQLFAEQAELFPNSIAIEFECNQVTYGELAKTINKTANYLWSRGLRPGQIVAVSLDRTPELIACLFAILQCGASYVPVDTSYPDARLDLIFEDSDATFYISLNSTRKFSDKLFCISITDILKLN